MSTSPVIQVENLSKYYRLGLIGGGTLNEDINRWVAKLRGKPDPLLKVGEEDNGNRKDGQIWALRDVSLEVNEGEILGIIGRNGAGKSTLLKILSKITAPTEGRIKIRGRVGSLLEVGTGFHPELTGRENIFLNGTILGMTHAEVSSKLEEIVEFAEMGKFIDTPVKRYSSGMRVRLAFAVAAHLEPEILIIDEVLAVGDAAFQNKCLGKMKDVASHGQTVLFVSHNMRSIADLCSRVIWIDSGQVRCNGQSNDIVNEYLSAGISSVIGSWRRDSLTHTDPFSDVNLLRASVWQEENKPAAVVTSDALFHINIVYEVSRPVTDCAIVLRIINMSGTNIFTSWDADTGFERSNFRNPGIYCSTCTVPAHFLKPGRYSVTMAAHIYRVKVFDLKEKVFSFDVSHVGCRFNDEREGVVQPLLKWDVSRQ